MKFKMMFFKSKVGKPEEVAIDDLSPDAFRVVKATMLIQKWYRRYKARLEARRQYTWNIFTQLEYASEQDQVRLYSFFSDVIMEMESDKSSMRNMILSGLRPTTISIREEDEHVRKVANPDSISVENSYKGFRLSWPLGREQLAGMINSFKDKQVLHAKYVVELLLAVRDQLKRQPNINHVSSGMYSDVTLCGDLHGQLEDLITIFYKNGLPSSSNCYIFNGDLVDRGQRSVEVTLVVFACFLLYPNAVFFNRGNHEDHVVNCRYGFIKEVTSKYKAYATRILALYKDIFSWLPLLSIIDHRVMAMHGGCTDMLDLKMLERVDRHKYLSALKPSNLEEIENILQTGAYANSSPEVLEWKQILDLLWSDPRPQRGCHPNVHRGGGMYWGPDISENILQKYKLELIVRSHECKADGFEYTHDDRVLTIFSASNYYSPNSNKGAVLKLAGDGVPRGPSLQPKILQYAVSQKRAKAAQKVTLRESVSVMERSALQNIQAKIMANKPRLLDEFRRRDSAYTGKLPMAVWVECVENVLGLSLPWRQLARRLNKVGDDNRIRYTDLFNTASGSLNSGSTEGVFDEGDEVMETLYQNRESLETIFRLMDKDNSGKLSFDEFENGCRLLSKHVGNSLNGETIHNMALSMDVNRDGQIDFNEFLEGIRLVTKFGKDRSGSFSSTESFHSERQASDPAVVSLNKQIDRRNSQKSLTSRNSSSALLEDIIKHTSSK